MTATSTSWGYDSDVSDIDVMSERRRAGELTAAARRRRAAALNALGSDIGVIRTGP